MLALLAYTFLLLFLTSLFQIVRSFLHKSFYGIKLHLKYATLFLILGLGFTLIHDYVFKLKVSNDNDTFSLLSFPIVIIFSIFIDKSGFDIFKKSLYMNLPNNRDKYGLRRDFFSAIKIGTIYLALILIDYKFLWKKFSLSENTIIIISILLIGIIHLWFFSKLWAFCPFCDNRISNITVNTGAINCRYCTSRIVIENNKLLRPRGRSSNMSDN